MKVFWSWQSDTPAKTGRAVIKAALEMALEKIATENQLAQADRLELDHDTKDASGWLEIVSTIFAKIGDAAVFVADATPTCATDSGKRSPNPNVLIELGYALKTLGDEFIVLVWNTAGGTRAEDLPFDMRHRRAPIPYCLAPGASNEEIAKASAKLAYTLQQVLEPALARALALRDLSKHFDLRPSRAGDPSIWTQYGEKIEGQEIWVEPSRWRAYDVVEAPRSYVRMIPFGWTRASPPVERIEEICRDTGELGPLFDEEAGWMSNGLGAARVFDCEYPIPQTISVTQWFRTSGEVWTFDAAVIEEYAGLRRLDGPMIVSHWYRFVRETIALYASLANEYPIEFPMRIEVGISNIKNMCWKEGAPDIGIFVAQPGDCFATEKEFTAITTIRKLDDQLVVEFLTKAYNQLRSLFKQEHMTEEAVKKILA